VAGHCQHGPARLAEYRARDFVGIGDQRITAGHLRRQRVLDAAEQLLVLDLLVAEPHQPFERHLVAQAVAHRHLQRLSADEALQQPEDAGIAAALHVAHRALLLGRQERQVVDLGEPVREEFAAEIEGAAAENVGIDVPADALGSLDAAGIAGAVAVLLEQALGGGRDDEIDGGVHAREKLDGDRDVAHSDEPSQFPHEAGASFDAPLRPGQMSRVWCRERKTGETQRRSI
jgi:hypothetical protein